MTIMMTSLSSPPQFYPPSSSGFEPIVMFPSNRKGTRSTNFYKSYIDKFTSSLGSVHINKGAFTRLSISSRVPDTFVKRIAQNAAQSFLSELIPYF
jgi:hypothetical protein